MCGLPQSVESGDVRNLPNYWSNVRLSLTSAQFTILAQLLLSE